VWWLYTAARGVEMFMTWFDLSRKVEVTIVTQR
jgi:hypothetical protein